MIGCKEISGIRSKKCKLQLVERQGTKYFLLVYARTAPCEMQYDMLRQMRMRGLRVPKVVQMADGEILLEFIEGGTLYEELCSGPVFKFSMLATAFAKMLQDFCTNCPDKRMGDIDLRAYVVRGSVLFGMDFDCIITGTYAESVADALCSIIGEPKISKDRQMAFCRYLYAASKLSKEEIDAALAQIMPLCNNLPMTKDELLKAIL